MNVSEVGLDYMGSHKDNGMNNAVVLLNAMWSDEDRPHVIGTLENKIFKNHSVDNAHEAAKFAVTSSEKGIDAYFAMSEFADHSSRLATNAVGASAFWLDIDCGQEKYDKGTGYLTKKEACAAITKFCVDAGLPQPTHLVDSGNGLHAYWALGRLIPRTEWLDAAHKFKALTVKYGLIADPTCTTDLARVLRVPSTNNYKDKNNPKLVKLKYAYTNISADEFIGAINADRETTHTDLTQLFKPKQLGAYGTKTDEPFPYEENKHDFYDALCAAYPNPATRDEWRAGVCALAYLIVVVRWPENETRLMRESWENLAKDAAKTDNEAQWRDALARTEDRIKSGEEVTTHLTVLKKARENSWQPKAKALDALQSSQKIFALISCSGKVGVIDKQRLNATKDDGTAAQLIIMSRIDGGLLVQRHLSSEFPQVDSKATLSTFIHSKDTTLYNGVEFNPRSTTPNVLNLWVGITIKPRLGKWDLIYVLLHDVICGGRDSEYQYLIKFIAHALQRPWEKPGVMIILLGGQGIGKGTLAKLLQKIWSATFLQVNRIKQVVGDFNGSLERAYIVFLDEALFAGDRNSSDALKSLVTEPTISINEKHQPARQITSYHRFFSATNADHFKSTDRDDRRDFVLRVSEHRKGDYAFWNALNAEIENSGAAAFTNDLMSMDLTGFNVRAKPNTRELTEQKLQSLEKFPRWWFGILSRGNIRVHEDEWPEFIGTTSLTSLFLESEKSMRSYKQLIDRDVVVFMSKLCPSAVKDRCKDGLHRRYGFRLPNITNARKDFELYIGDKITWDDVGGQD